MARELAIYLVMHQPRRLRLPARPIPAGATVEEMEEALFDDAMNEFYFRKVARTSYEPALRLLEKLAREGLSLGVGLSLSFLDQADRYAPDLVRQLKQLLSLPNVEVIGVEPYHSFLPYIDIQQFQKRMGMMARKLQRRFGKRIRVTDTTEMMMSNDIYFALTSLGFDGAVMDGREWVLGERQATHLYHGGRPFYLMARHLRLSDDVGYRFSDRSWPGYPLMAPNYADWIAETDGDFVFLGWDFETFGEHHRNESGIFPFLERLPLELKHRAVDVRTPSEIIARHAPKAELLTLPVIPSTWAGSGGIDFFLGNSAQEWIFRLMHHAYHKALLTGRKEFLDLALWLLQSDNLHLIQWYGRFGPEAEVSAYFTPKEWWGLGADGIIAEMGKVYEGFVRALDEHMPIKVGLPVAL